MGAGLPIGQGRPLGGAAAQDMEASKLGRYAIQSELGRGAMGVVYKATDTALERTVAVKTVNMALERDGAEKYEARFYQEARAAGSLNHPNIVTVYDVGKAGNVVYMAMEFIEGRRAALAARRGARAAGVAGGVDRSAGRRGPRLRAPARRGAPRHQARQHHGGDRRAR